MNVKLQSNVPNRILDLKTFILLFVFIGFTTSFAQNMNAHKNATVDGGYLTTVDGDTEVTICLDGIEDPIFVNLEGASGRIRQWIITDDNDNILALPENPPFDLDGAPPGVCRIYHLSYNGLKPLSHKHVKNLSDLKGQYDLSNYIEVTRQQKPTGGTIEGGPFTFCVQDGEADHIPDGVITLSGNSGANSQWIVTDDYGNILGLSPSPYAVNFDAAPAGTCFVWHLSYEDGLLGAEAGNNVADLEGCFSLSNPISVVRNDPEGGTLEGGPFTFCVRDDEADHIPEGAITLAGNFGSNSQWVVTDDQGNILGLPPSPYAVNFDAAPGGTCLVWHLSYEDGLEGAEPGNNAADLLGCYSLSNPITVVRNATEGGTLEGGPFNFTVGDATADFIEDGVITLSGNVGANSQWVVTNADGTIILGLPDHYKDVDFNGANEGTCLIWHLSYEDGLVGLEAPEEGDHLVSNLQGCFNLSNSVEVNRTGPSSVISVFPNPTKSSITIDTSSIESKNLGVEIFNLQNVRLYSKQEKGSSFKAANTINVSAYRDGIYLVRITDYITGQHYTKRFVIKR